MDMQPSMRATCEEDIGQHWIKPDALGRSGIVQGFKVFKVVGEQVEMSCRLRPI